LAISGVIMMEAFVHIIESPSDLDLLQDRKQGGALGEALRLAEIPHSYNLVTTHDSFKMALHDGLIQAMKDYPDKLPILHFTMHGDERGIELTDKTYLSWDEIREFLLPIYEVLGGLLICMSSCKGSSAFKIAKSTYDIPFLFLLGNNDLVSWSDATVAYITFYHLIFKFGLENIRDHVEVMKNASGNNNFELWGANDVKQYYRQVAKKNSLELLKKYLRKRAKNHS
jgi:hypothetical protein